MKKKIKDCTFKEFTGWANDRACDGRWSMQDAMNSVRLLKRRLLSHLVTEGALTILEIL